VQHWPFLFNPWLPVTVALRQGQYWQASSSSPSKKKNPRNLCNPNVHYSVHNSDSELLSTGVSCCHILFLFVTIHITIFVCNHFVLFVNTCSAYCTVHPDRTGSVGCHLLGTFVNVKVLQVSVRQPILRSCKVRIVLFCVLLIHIGEKFVTAVCSGAVKFWILTHFLWRNNNVLCAGRPSVRDVPSAAKPFVLYELVQNVKYASVSRKIGLAAVVLLTLCDSPCASPYGWSPCNAARQKLL